MNLSGKTFGKLRVLMSDENKKGYVVCECKCGETKSIRATSLTKQSSPTRSCGCTHKEIAKLVGQNNIVANSKEQIETNIKFNTNIQVISSSIPPKNNTSGHKGLHFRRGGWSVYIQLHGKRKYLGWFKNKKDAVSIRKEAEEKFYAAIIKAAKEEKLSKGENST